MNIPSTVGHENREDMKIYNDTEIRSIFLQMLYL